MQPAIIRPGPASVHTISMLCHVLAFAGYIVPFGHIIGPLVLWLLKKHESPLIDRNGKESLNFQISITIYSIACIPLMFILVGFFLLLAIVIFDLVMVVLAAVKAHRGELVRYPLTIRLVK